MYDLYDEGLSEKDGAALLGAGLLVCAVGVAVVVGVVAGIAWWL